MVGFRKSIAFTSLMVVVLGCDGSHSLDAGRVPTVPAKGRVVRTNNTPVTGGIITLTPLPDGGSAYQAAGPIQPDGSFVLGSVQPADGAVPGKYHVVLESPGVKIKAKDPIAVEVVPGQDLEIKIP